MHNWIDLTDQRFGRLKAIRYAGNGKWFCRCDCGGDAVCFTSNLRKGNSTSCGCKNRERRFGHGFSGTHIHLVWRQMRERCNNPNHRSYHNYGGRGIKVCERWDEFPNFLSDMGPRPDGYDIDRIDNDGDYSPENCRWVARSQNLRNTRTATKVTWNGVTRSLPEWAEIAGISLKALKHRIARGWSIDRTMTQPMQKRKCRK